jgi:hypothetical protein
VIQDRWFSSICYGNPDVIEYAIGADVTQDFKRAAAEVEETAWERLFRKVDGKRLDTGQECAEVCVVPSWVGHKKPGPVYRYLAICEPLNRDTIPKKGQDSKLSDPRQSRGLIPVSPSKGPLKTALKGAWGVLIPTGVPIPETSCSVGSS